MSWPNKALMSGGIGSPSLAWLLVALANLWLWLGQVFAFLVVYDADVFVHDFCARHRCLPFS